MDPRAQKDFSTLTAKKIHQQTKQTNKQKLFAVHDHIELAKKKKEKIGRGRTPPKINQWAF